MKAYELMNVLGKLPCDTEIKIAIPGCSEVPITYSGKGDDEDYILQSSQWPELFNDDGDSMGTLNVILNQCMESTEDE